MAAAVRPQTGPAAGFTLVEVAIAMTMVFMVVVSYIGLRTTAVGEAIEARNWRLARELAEERMSELLAGAHEISPRQESGVTKPFEDYPGFSYQIVIGETEISELESSLAAEAAEGDQQATERNDWQKNRDLYRKASARGLSYTDYQDQLAEEEYQRQLEATPPSETEFEDVAVVVYFPKVDGEFEGEQESFLIKARASTLAISGQTPEQARMEAESRGQAPGADGPTTPAGDSK